VIDANAGFSFEVQVEGKWWTVIAWADDGWPMVLDPRHGALTRAVDNDGVRYSPSQSRSGLTVPAEWTS
jgi:hypothetical protein